MLKGSRMKNIQSDSLQVKQIPGLTTSMMGVKFIFSEEKMTAVIDKTVELNLFRKK